jgi:hypothetical protein
MRRRRRGFFFWVIVLALLVYALVYSNTKVVLREYDVSSPDLPSAFSGTRVAVVADTHGRFDQEIVDICADADFIVLAGDIIDADSQKDDALAFAKKLVETGKPTYYVTGNHEWSTTVAETFKDALEARGVHVMDDKVLTYERGEASITIAGRSDENVHGDRPSPEALLAGTQAEDFVLLISHRPYDYDEYAALGADLIVSGHLHGGLIRLPGLGGLIGPGRDFLPELDGGTYPAANGATLVVSRGLAGVKLNNTSFHWMRLFNPREVVMITLTKG